MAVNFKAIICNFKYSLNFKRFGRILTCPATTKFGQYKGMADSQFVWWEIVAVQYCLSGTQKTC